MPTILLIDDHTCGSHTLAHKLRAYGYEVQVALDAKKALTLFRLYAVDAVVTDCHPEISDGEIIAPTLRRISPDVPIIMMSAFCGVPCRRLRYADAWHSKGGCRSPAGRVADAALLPRLWAVLICCGLRRFAGFASRKDSCDDNL
jgi:CheY-like chemotaxis protein